MLIHFHLATDNQKFNDSSAYYQFVPDSAHDQPLQHTDFAPISTFMCQTIMVSEYILVTV